MKKIILGGIVITILIIGYWLASPLWRTTKVSEDLPISTDTTIATSTVLKVGSFTGFDRVHAGSGTAKLVRIDGKNYLRFEEDFTVTNGPDLYVGFGKNGEYIKGSELAALKGNVGSQNYELPSTVIPGDIQEIWIWCKAFSVPFSKAVLK